VLQRKIHKTELLLLAQIGTKSFVGWGFAPDPTGAAYSAPDPLAGLGGAPAGRGTRKGREKGSEREVKGQDHRRPKLDLEEA